jgi:hypothetical protein
LRSAVKAVLGGTWMIAGAALAFAGLTSSEMPAVLTGLTITMTGLVVLLDGVIQ